MVGCLGPSHGEGVQGDQCCASTFSMSPAFFHCEQHSHSPFYTSSLHSNPLQHHLLDKMSLCCYPSYYLIPMLCHHLSPHWNRLLIVSLNPASLSTTAAFIANGSLLKSPHSIIPTLYSLLQRLHCIPTLYSLCLYHGHGSFPCFSFSLSLYTQSILLTLVYLHIPLTSHFFWFILLVLSSHYILCFLWFIS